MSDFRQVRGFEDNWRPELVRPRPQRSVLPQATWNRLNRLIAHAPEAVVRVTAGLKSPRALARHLDYISRKGELELHGAEGRTVEGRDAVREVAEDWSWVAGAEGQASPLSPIARSMVLSIPSGPDPARVEAAASTFAAETFAERFEYLYVRHEDGAHPHVHLTVRALGLQGERLTPRLPDLRNWRLEFARALRENGIEAEATSRRLRGVSIAADRPEVFRIRQRHELGQGPKPRVELALDEEVKSFGLEGDDTARLMETRLRRSRRSVAEVYIEIVGKLQGSAEPADRALGQSLMTFVNEMGRPTSRRYLLAQQRSAEALVERIRQERETDRGRERTR